MYIGLVRTIHIRCIYGIIGRKITEYMVIYGVCIRFWPTLQVCCVCGYVLCQTSVFCFARIQGFNAIPLRPHLIQRKHWKYIVAGQTLHTHVHMVYLWHLEQGNHCTCGRVRVCIYIYMNICVYIYTHIYKCVRVYTRDWPPYILGRFPVGSFRQRVG
jgi:hypothetical protein